MANGDIRKLGTFYMNNVKQARPTRPWRNGFTPAGAPGAGNIPKYTSGNIQIRDTDANDAYKINWVEVNDGDKKLLIADRNILVNVSWDTLNAQGLISGKDVTIDGQQYKLRVLTGGSSYRSGTDGFSGGLPSTNEWDRIITNEGNFSGLPKPNTTDLDSTGNETDRLGVHNSKWNWYYCRTWCQETRAGDSSTRSSRGNIAARFCLFGPSSHVYVGLGWRPVLEFPKSTPLISGSDGSLGVLTEPLVKTYSVSDSRGDEMTIIERLDGKEIRRITTKTSRDLTIDLTNVWSSLSAGAHRIDITATDVWGDSSVRTWQFGKNIGNGLVHKLGTFYMDGVKQLNPNYPWQNGSTPTGAPGAGNIPVYTSGGIEIRDTDVSDAYKINWVEVNDGDKKLLIADRNILVNVSWDTLNAQGLIFGKNVTIDGHLYKLRVLTGGSSFRPGGSHFEGGWPSTNDWDRIITNESNFSGLPVPVGTDLDTVPNEADRLGIHNQMWNWYRSRTWCQETFADNVVNRCVRGSHAARDCTFRDFSSESVEIGWRPVLEPITQVISYLYKDNDGYKYRTNTWNLIGETVTNIDFYKHGVANPIIDINILNELNGDVKMVVGKIKEDEKSLVLNMSATPKDKVVIPNRNINISGIANIDHFSMVGDGKVLFSLDGGITYNTVSDSKLVSVDLQSDDIYDVAIDKDLLSNLPVEVLSEILNSNVIRIAYVLRDNDTIDNVSMQVDLKAITFLTTAGITFDVEYLDSTKAIVKIYKNGNYVINTYKINEEV